MSTNNKTKTSKQLERYFKGAANHRRISILLLVLKSPGISVEGISESLDCNFKTISEQTFGSSRATKQKLQGEYGRASCFAVWKNVL